jgi:hypothetical protein
VPDGMRAIYFRSVPGRYYGLEVGDTVHDIAKLVAVKLSGPGSKTQTRFLFEHPSGPIPAFYRIRLLP